MADQVPAVPVALPTIFTEDQLFLRLAREIAMDIQPLDAILQTCSVSAAQWERIKTNPRFTMLLVSNQETWASSLNTAERVRVKSLAMVEEVLPEFYQRMNDRKEALSGRVEVLKTIAKFAGVGEKSGEAALGERFTVTINLGGDQQLKIEKGGEPVTQQVTPSAPPPMLLQAMRNADGTLDVL